MEPSHKVNPLKQLHKICHDDLGPTSRIALLTFHHQRPSKLFEMILILIEHLQLISQIIILNSSIYTHPLQSGILYASKLLNPGYLISFEEQSTTSTVVLSFLLLLSIFKYALIAYIAYVSAKKLQGNSHLINFGAWIFKSQGRVIYSITTSYWLNLALAISQDKLDMKGYKAMIVPPIMLIILEFVLSFYLQFQFCTVFPTKSLLAAKTNTLELSVLTHKVILQTLQFALSLNALANAWITTSISLTLVLIRHFYYFRTLPLYNIKALVYVSGLLATTVSLNVACLAQVLLVLVGEEPKMSFIVMVWGILTLLIVRVSSNYLLRAIRNMLLSPIQGSAELLVHRTSIIKQFRELRRLACAQNTKYEWSYLMNMTIDVNLKRILNLDQDTFSNQSVNMDNKESRNKAFAHYLETLLAMFPKSSLVKVHAAYFYIKKLRMYWKGMKIISELKLIGPAHISLNASLLIYESQEKIRSSYSGQLDLLQYIKTQTAIYKLKDEIVKQVGRQTTLFKEVIADRPDLMSIFTHAQSFNYNRIRLEKKIRLTLEQISPYCIEPLEYIAQYYLILNYSYTDYRKYCRLFEMKYRKNEKFYALDELCEENLYQHQNGFVVLSGHKIDAGKVLLCNKPVEGIYGGQASSYIGTQISSRASPGLVSFYANFYQYMVESGETALFNNIIRGYGFHQDGYMVEADFYMNFHPFTCEGLYLDLIIRRIFSSNEYMMIHENGDLECTSEELGKELGTLFPHSERQRRTVHVSSISEDLDLVNKAFNMVALPDKYPESHDNLSKDKGSEGNADAFKAYKFRQKSDKSPLLSARKERSMSIENAEEIYATYTKGGRRLKLDSVKHSEVSALSSDSYFYTCKVSNVFYGTKLMKLVVLNKVKRKMTIPPKQRLRHSAIDPNQDTERLRSQRRGITKDTERTTFEGVDTFKIDDKKEDEWMDLSALDSRRPLKSVRQATLTGANFDEKASPRSYSNRTQECLDNTPMKLNSTLFEIVETKEQVSCVGVSLENHEDQTINIDRTHRRNASTSNQISEDSQGRHRSEVFKTALAVGYSPIIFRSLCAILYILLACVFGLQVSLRTFMFTGVDSIYVNMDVLNNLQFRDDLLVNTQVYWTIFSQLRDGRIAASAGLPSTEVLRETVKDELLNIINTNKMLIKNARYMDDTTRQILFQRTVEIYNSTYGSVHLNTFEAVSSLSVATMKAISNIIQ